MMLTTQLDFGGSPTPTIGVEWWGEPLRPITKRPGQLAGMGAEPCPGMPPSPVANIMSTPSCSPQDAGCVALTSEIQSFNLAAIKDANNQYNREVCVHNACLNGEDGQSRCTSQYPPVSLPSQPYSPTSVMIQSHNGGQSYSAGQGGDYGSSGATPLYGPDETAQARQVYQQALARYNVANNAAINAMFEAEFSAGLSWWKSNHNGSTMGMATYIAPLADGVVQGWMRKAGVTTSPVLYATGTDESGQARQIYQQILARYGVASNYAINALFESDFSAGVAWWKSTHNGSTAGLAAYIAPLADGVVQDWMRKAGVTKADGTPTVPTPQNTKQAGNVDTSQSSDNANKNQDVSGAPSSTNSGVFLALGAVALVMLAKGGK